MTYAIVAREPVAGEVGGAVQTHFFNAGAVVLWPEAGTGVVATMAMAETAYGRLGLHLMRRGVTAEAALTQLLQRDSMSAVRQVAMLDLRGAPAAHTGEVCIPAAGHRCGRDVVALGNMLAREGTWDRMVDAYQTATGPLAARLLAALEAGEQAGGDIRGKQSAAIVVVKSEADPDAGQIGTGVIVPQVDLRVDDSREPLIELRRLMTLDSFYKELLALLTTPGLFVGPFTVTAPTWSAAADTLKSGQRLLGDNQEATFWLAVLLARAGELTNAQRQMAVAVSVHPPLREFATRLVGQNMLTGAQAAALCT
jgi:uncharacterized Ntn-hydrolase superfamily protein